MENENDVVLTQGEETEEESAVQQTSLARKIILAIVLIAYYGILIFVCFLFSLEKEIGFDLLILPTVLMCMLPPPLLFNYYYWQDKLIFNKTGNRKTLRTVFAVLGIVIFFIGTVMFTNNLMKTDVGEEVTTTASVSADETDGDATADDATASDTVVIEATPDAE